MVNNTLVGSEGTTPPTKTYPEMLEIRVRNIISTHVEEGEQRNELLLDLLEFITDYGGRIKE